MKTLFLEINDFKVAFIPNFSNCTFLNQFCYEDQFFRDVSDRFAIQGHRLYGAGHTCNPFSGPQNFSSRAAVLHSPGIDCIFLRLKYLAYQKRFGTEQKRTQFSGQFDNLEGITLS